jgi:hypothetical protein
MSTYRSKMDAGVFVRPDWNDSGVNRRFSWLMDYAFWTGNDVVFHAMYRGLETHDLTRGDAIRLTVERVLKDVDPVFFFHFSHGAPNLLTGQNMSSLICSPGIPPNLICSPGCPGISPASPCTAPNHEILQDRVVYSLSCSSAKQLGRAVVQAHGISYIGYENSLYLFLLEGGDSDQMFKEIWAGGAKVLIDGGTTKEAYNWLRRRYEYWISYWEMKPPTNPQKVVALFCLNSDLDGLRLLGKKDATIRSKSCS